MNNINKNNNNINKNNNNTILLFNQLNNSLNSYDIVFKPIFKIHQSLENSWRLKTI